MAFFLNTQHICNFFFLGREKNGHDTISWLHVFAAMHDSATMRPFHEIIDCTTYVCVSVCVCVYIYIYIYMCVCVCVCFVHSSSQNGESDVNQQILSRTPRLVSITQALVNCHARNGHVRLFAWYVSLISVSSSLTYVCRICTMYTYCNVQIHRYYRLEFVTWTPQENIFN
jgi:hypothetical protein